YTAGSCHARSRTLLWGVPLSMCAHVCNSQSNVDKLPQKTQTRISDRRTRQIRRHRFHELELRARDTNPARHPLRRDADPAADGGDAPESRAQIQSPTYTWTHNRKNPHQTPRPPRRNYPRPTLTSATTSPVWRWSRS